MKHRARLLAIVLTATAAATNLVSTPAASAAGYSVEPVPEQSWTANRTVYDILTVGDRVYIAGAFSRVRNMATGERERRDRLAAFDRVTGELLDWNPGADDTVRALAASTDGTTIFAGGLFTVAGGAPNERIAALSSDTGESRGRFRASANHWVRDLLVRGDSLFAAGAFRNVNGVRRRAVVKLDGQTGDVDTGFDARVTTGRVFALAPTGDLRVLIGGTFEGLGGSAHRFLAAVSRSDGTASAWTPAAVCERCRVLDATVDEGVVYAAVGGPGGRAAAWRLDQTERLWTRGADGDVQAVSLEGDYVYFGGHFGPTFSGQEAHQLVALSKSDGVLQSWQVAFVGTDKPGVWAVDAGPEHLRVGGSFQGVGSQGEAARYAVFAPVVATG